MTTRPFSPSGVAAVLGLSHFVIDLAGGVLLGTVARGPEPWAIALVLAFQILSTAGQLVLAPVLDGASLRRATTASVGIAWLATALLPWSATLAVILAGIAAASFHVSAGAWALRLGRGRATEVGLFAAPGIVGLGLGVTAGLGAVPLTWILLTLLAAIAIVLSQQWPAPVLERHRPPELDPSRSRSSLLAFLLVGASARACAWDGLDWVASAAGDGLLIVLAAGLGKALGGLLTDRVGPRRHVLVVLPAAALTWVTVDHGPALLLVAALLMSVVPATYVLAQRHLHRSTTAAAMVSGASLLIGALPWLAFDGSWLTSATGVTIVLGIATVGLATASPDPTPTIDP